MPAACAGTASAAGAATGLAATSGNHTPAALGEEDRNHPGGMITLAFCAGNQFIRFLDRAQSFKLRPAILAKILINGHVKPR